MKNVIIKSMVLFCFVINLNAQDFQGTAIYSSKTQLKGMDIKSEGMSPNMLEEIKEKMKKAFEKTYILNFSKSESVYQEEEKLKMPEKQSINVVTFSSGSDRSKIYKNLKEKKYVSEEDIFGKEFLIIDSLPRMNWILENEEKKIGNYTCYKAKMVKPVTEEAIKKHEELKKKQEEGKSNFMIVGDLKDQVIEAWYTLDIPISNGPGKYWGLPGLILELHEGKTTYLCSKIILNTEDKIEIKAPKSGKKVTQNEFDNIKEERLQKMMNDNGVIEIKMH